VVQAVAVAVAQVQADVAGAVHSASLYMVEEQAGTL
jgi:hypothetical protein